MWPLPILAPMFYIFTFQHSAPSSNLPIVVAFVVCYFTIGSKFLFIHCLRKVEQYQGSYNTDLQTQNQTDTETSSLFLAEAHILLASESINKVYLCFSPYASQTGAAPFQRMVRLVFISSSLTLS